MQEIRRRNEISDRNAAEVLINKGFFSNSSQDDVSHPRIFLPPHCNGSETARRRSGFGYKLTEEQNKYLNDSVKQHTTLVLEMRLHYVKLKGVITNETYPYHLISIFKKAVIVRLDW